MKAAKLLICLIGLSLMGSGSSEEILTSEFGPADTLGAVNRLTAESVLNATKLVKFGKTYALGVETGPDSPAYGSRSYQMTVLQLDDGLGTPAGTNKVTGNDDLVHSYIGIGSQIDGLGHVGINHRYYNNIHASEFVKVNGLTKFSTSQIPPIVTRGVLLDMATLRGKKILAAGTSFNETEIRAAEKSLGVTIQEGDVVLFHTGWLNISESDSERFMKGEPGLGKSGARYLASKKIVAVGSDTFGVEVIPFEREGEFFPVHQEMLTKNGIYILENMDTRALAADGVSEFLFVLGQPRLYGSVQAIINPVAIR